MQPETKHGMRDDLIRRLLNVGLREPGSDFFETALRL
jgi:hypothetical protein